MINIAITFGDRDGAREMARRLLDAKAIACANIFPVESFYTWQGEFREEGEYLLLAKTGDRKYTEVKELVSRHHPYDTPLIEAWKIDQVNRDYEEWLEGELA